MRKIPFRTIALFSAALVSILWGLSFVGSQKAVEGGLTTFSLICVRYFAAVPAMFLLVLAVKGSFRMKLRDLPMTALSTLTGITVYYYCEIEGILFTSPSVASLITATTPVFTLFAGIVIKKKKPRPVVWVSLALSLAGVYLVVFSGTGENSLKGLMFMFTACLCWVVYLEVTDRLLKTYSTLTLSFWQSVIALITLIPLAVAEKTDWHAVTPSAWLWAALFLGLVCSGLCFLLNNYSVAVLSPQLNAFFLNLSPVVTALGEFFFLGTRITPVQIAGGVIVLISLFLVSRKPVGASS